ncbi:succinyldiaminopimelate transaminase [Sulfurihydrogenibium sp.]|uniref:succinyldiaminopimelate transaminase n=1 Tax=Sulfurihydrogenibium sp. TaxID=2053621 RepID=UPI0026054201|nr:succinyldiaminopimelate transaminase [Sulfurihydrogenibium sp.]
MNKIIKNLKNYPMEELNRIKASLKEKGIKIYDFGTGDPKEPTPNFIRKALIDAVPEVSQYPSVLGRKELRHSISKWFEKRFNVKLNPDTQIIPSAGSKEAIFHFPLVFIDPQEDKKRVIFGTPAYPVYERGTLYADGIPTAIKLREEDGFLLRLDKIEKSILEETKIVWINYPHNPTGAVAPPSYFEETIKICQEYDIILCSDECYTEIYFDEKPHSALEFGIDNVVVFHSLSKRSGMTGYRSGFVAGDEKIISFYRKERANFGVASPDFIQQAAKSAWEDENHVIERNKIFKQKRDLFIEFLDRIGLEYLYPKATFYIWIKSPKGIPAKDYVKALLENGIVVSIGENFCSSLEITEGNCESDYFRIALVPNLEECKEAIKVWETVHKDLVK